MKVRESPGKSRKDRGFHGQPRKEWSKRQIAEFPGNLHKVRRWPGEKAARQQEEDKTNTTEKDEANRCFHIGQTKRLA